MTLDIQNLINDEVSQFEKFCEEDEAGYPGKTVALLVDRFRHTLTDTANFVESDSLEAAAQAHEKYDKVQAKLEQEAYEQGVADGRFEAAKDLRDYPLPQ